MFALILRLYLLRKMNTMATRLRGDGMKIQLDIESWCDVFAAQADVSQHVFWVSQLDYQEHLFVSEGFKQLWGANHTVMYDHPTYFDSRLISEPIDSFWQKCLVRHNEQSKGSVLFQIKNEQGEMRWVKDRFMTLYDAKGQPLAAAGIAMDVTEQMDLVNDERRLQQVNAQHHDLKSHYTELLKDKLNILAQQKYQHQPELTTREKQCLLHLSKGLSARETADILNISRRTVEKHLDNVKLKFNCSKKVELMRLLMEGNFLDDVSS